MGGASSRTKGHNFEREFCRWVRETFGIEFNRNLKQYATAQEGDTDPLFGFLPECKSYKTVTRGSKRQWYAQAVTAAKRRDLIPLLVYKVPMQGWYAAFPHPSAWETGQDWRYDYEYAVHVEPPLLELILREMMG